MTIDTLNDHLVGVQGDMITMMIPATGPMTCHKKQRRRVGMSGLLRRRRSGPRPRSGR